MKLHITIDLTFKAMEGNRDNELDLILRSLRFGLHKGETKGVLLDSNGHDCGDWKIVESMHEMPVSRLGSMALAPFRYELPINSATHAKYCEHEAESRYNGKLIRDEVGMLVVKDKDGITHTDDVLRALSKLEPRK